MAFSLKKIVPFHEEEAAEEIRFLDQLCFQPTDRKIELEYGAWWLVYANKEAVAYAGVRSSRTFKGWGYLSRAGVHPKWRGHKLQKKLLQVRINYSRARGWQGLITDTSYGNIHSANNLISAGFKMFNPPAPWTFSDASYWIRNF